MEILWGSRPFFLTLNLFIDIPLTWPMAAVETESITQSHSSPLCSSCHYQSSNPEDHTPVSSFTLQRQISHQHIYTLITYPSGFCPSDLSPLGLWQHLPTWFSCLLSPIHPIYPSSHCCLRDPSKIQFGISQIWKINHLFLCVQYNLKFYLIFSENWFLFSLIIINFSY